MDNAENIPFDRENEGKAGELRESSYEIGNKKPPIATRFSADKQPDPAKSATTRRKKAIGRELLRELLNLKYGFKTDSSVMTQLETAFGKRVRRCTVEELISLQLFQRAILGGNVQAAREIFNQAYGLPKQILEHSGPDGKPIEMNNTVKRVMIQNPHIVSPQTQQ